MRLESGIYAGRESLVVHGGAISTIADNLANSNTPGYKTSRVEFCDLIADSGGCLYSEPVNSGEGVMAQSISQAHERQGAIDSTDRPLDAAITGKGFFVIRNGVNEQYYTRAGNFVTDSAGNLNTVTGESVLGYTPASPDTLVPLNVTTSSNSATATTTMAITGNLDSGELPVTAVPNNPATFRELNEATTFRTSTTIVDSLGIEHDISLHFFLTDAQTRSWRVDAYTDAGETGGVEDTPTLLGSSSLSFDQTGQITAGSAPQLTINAPWGNGAAASSIVADLSKFTAFAGSSSISGVTSNGSLAGSLSSVEIAENGDVIALLNNGSTTVIGQIALAVFPSTNGLERVGSNSYRETEFSGTPVIGLPNVEGRGTLIGKSLESSIVDPATEFIALIRFQRAYQAGSQVISTASELMNTTIQLA